MSDKRGFTLVEILVALGVGAIILAAIYSMVNLSQKISSGMERRVAAQQDEKTALELMAMEIGMASYTANSLLWVNPATCNGVSPNLTDKGIQVATANSITIEMDINDNGYIQNTTTGAVDANEIIGYNYDTGNLYITRETNCGGAMPFLGDRDIAANVGKRTVRVINNSYNPVIPVFRYFDGNGIEIFPTAANPAPIPNIRRIEITLAVETENPDINNGQRKKMIYSTSVIVRNHVP